MQTGVKKTISLIIVILIMAAGIVYGQEDSRYDADENLPFNENTGDVNPQTGSAAISVTDVALPGRAGCDAPFGWILSLNQINVFDKAC